MKVKNNVTLFEFGYITNDRKASEHEHIQVISDKAYQYLKGICLSDERERNLLKLKKRSRYGSAASTKLCRGVIYP